MTQPMHQTHDDHAHGHESGCGHEAVEHDGHVDYLHGGHLHHPHEGHVDEHVVGTGGGNLEACTPEHRCEEHRPDHAHGPDCEHEAVPHGAHTDYLVGEHLHHPHGMHCDDHGVLTPA